MCSRSMRSLDDNRAGLRPNLDPRTAGLLGWVQPTLHPFLELNTRFYARMREFEGRRETDVLNSAMGFAMPKKAKKAGKKKKKR